MRKKVKSGVLFVFLLTFICLITGSKFLFDRLEAQRELKAQEARVTRQATTKASKPSKQETPSTTSSSIQYKPIIDVSGWQMPSQINYDQMAENVSGVIVRVHSGAQAKKENNATYLNGLDKAYETHIKEFQKRNIPVAVYAYVAASSKKEMEKEAKEFYDAASKYKPTYYWLDVEEKTMSDMNGGVEAFRAKLKELGAENVGIYIGTYFILEHSIETNKFDAIWIPTYGADNGYFDAAPETDLDYDLHQYTSQGWLPGFDYQLDLNQLSTQKDQKETYQKLFGKK